MNRSYKDQREKGEEILQWIPTVSTHRLCYAASIFGQLSQTHIQNIHFGNFSTHVSSIVSFTALVMPKIHLEHLKANSQGLGENVF